METFQVSIPEDKKDFFIQFLQLIGAKFKKENSTEDWAQNLPENHLKSIEKGLNDIENGKVLTHDEAKRRIKEYIAERTK